MVKLVSTLVWVALVAFLCFGETQAQRSTRRKYGKAQATNAEPIKPAKRRDIPEEYTGIIFEDDVTTAGNPSPNLPQRNEIPLSFLSQLSNYSNLNDILTRFGREDPVSLHVRQGGVPETATTSRGRIHPGVKSAEYAGCEPQKMAVAFEKPREPSVIYFPFCTRVERCGGCCPHDLFECAPTVTEKATFQVTQLRYMGPGDGSLQHEGEVAIDVDRHIACECQCRVKEKDCKSNQMYLPHECRCECKNHEDAGNCGGMNKYWDPELCRCMCVNTPICSSGSKFNSETCSCEIEHTRDLRTFGDLDSTEVTSTQWFNSRPRKRGGSRSRLAVFD